MIHRDWRMMLEGRLRCIKAQKGKATFLQRFPMDSFPADVYVYMRALSHAILLAVNKCLFAHSDVS